MPIQKLSYSYVDIRAHSRTKSTEHAQDLETNSDSPVTAIASERGPSSVLLASFADGVIKVFDRRLEEEDAVVRSFNEHTNWVQNVRWQPQFGNQFVSARSELVSLWL